MMLVDTHCHLNFAPLSARVDRVVSRAEARDVTKIIVPGYDAASFAPIEALGRRPTIFPALGIHPWVASKPVSRDALIHHLTSAKAVAVGEIGLDFKVDVNRKRQQEVFEMQLSVAAKLGLPVILHVRGAFEEMLATLSRFEPRPRGVVHAFSRGPELAKRFVTLGFYVGFGGAVTHPRATRVRRAAKAVPLEKILLETDAPSIGLDGVLPVKVEPAHVADVAAALADIRGESADAIAEVTTRNAHTLFNLQKR